MPCLDHQGEGPLEVKEEFVELGIGVLLNSFEELCMHLRLLRFLLIYQNINLLIKILINLLKY